MANTKSSKKQAKPATEVVAPVAENATPVIAAAPVVAVPEVKVETVKEVVQEAGSKKKAAKKPATKKSSKKSSKKPAKAKKTASKKPAKVKAAPAEKAVVVAADNLDVLDAEKEKVGSRYFKLVYNNKVSGRFSGNKPKQAANKALTAIIKGLADGTAENKEITFRIKECTRGSKHKEYCYIGERLKLDTPMKVTIGKGDDAKVIEYKYANKVKKAKLE